MDPTQTDSSDLTADHDTDMGTDTDIDTSTGTLLDAGPPDFTVLEEVIDLTDPVFTVVALVAALLLTTAARKASRVKPALTVLLKAVVPLFAVLFAVMVRGVLDIVWGVPFAFPVLWQGVVAGSFAVTSHASWRSLVKQLPLLFAVLASKKPTISQ